METRSVPYDYQTSKQQAETRAQWDAEIAEIRASLNYQEVFAARGEAYSEATPDGQLVVHPARPSAEVDQAQ